jgi:uncharacterized protein (TIGR03437 family)
MKKTFRGTTALALGALPALLFAFSSGPDAHYTGAPGDQTCVACHLGTALNGGGGSVELKSAAGSTYAPGQQQQITITISDAKARVYGFELSARLDSDPANGQAGDFTAGNQQQVICGNNSLKKSDGCPSTAPLQFLEHSHPFTSNVITALWTPPASNVGTVTLFIAVNAANGDGNLTGDHIYTAKLQLTPSVTATQPSIIQNGVVSASAFNAQAGIAPGTWVEIYGSNLATTTRLWQGSDFNGADAPTTLEKVGVTIGGKNAYVDYVSPTQVNAQVPDGIPIGSGVPLVLTNTLGQTAPYSLQTSDLAPALLAPPSFAINGKQYAAATFPPTDSGSVVFVGPTGAITGVETRPAKAGDVVTLYGIGFGPVTPSIGAGVIAQQASSLTNPATILIGQAEAKVLYGGLAPGFVGLYQFNIQLPGVGGGDLPISVRVAGLTTSQSLTIATAQ